MNTFKRFFWIFIASIVVLTVLSWVLASTLATEWFEKGQLPTAFNFDLFERSSSSSSESQDVLQSSSESLESSKSSDQDSSVSTSEMAASQSGVSESSSSRVESQPASQASSDSNSSGKLVTTISGGSIFTGLNWRSAPCGEIKGQPKAWGSTGKIVADSTPQRVDTCSLGNFEWIQVNWDDGTQGWSITENLQITDNLPR